MQDDEVYADFRCHPLVIKTWWNRKVLGLMASFANGITLYMLLNDSLVLTFKLWLIHQRSVSGLNKSLKTYENCFDFTSFSTFDPVVFCSQNLP